MQEPEGTIQAGRRYVLGYRQDFYGIWDRTVPGKPVETFELTDTGLNEARKRIAQLSSQAFWVRVGPKALRWALFGGLALWIVGNLVILTRYAFDTPDFGVPPGRLIYDDPVWARLSQIAQDLGFRLWVGAVAILVALRLFDRSRQPTEPT
jgi:hypothetical protein